MLEYPEPLLISAYSKSLKLLRNDSRYVFVTHQLFVSLGSLPQFLWIQWTLSSLLLSLSFLLP